MAKFFTAAFVALFILARLSFAGGDPYEPAWEEIAPGVWTGIRNDSPRVPVMGNTTLVVSDEGVVVFDGGAAPLWSERVVEKIKSLTGQPVTHIVVSHWHGDHDYGIFKILEAYPAARVISHPYTRANLGKNFFNDSFLTEYIPYIRTRVEAKTYSNGQPMSDSDVARFQGLLDDADLIDRQNKLSQLTYPNATFEDSLTIWSGGREIRLMHMGLSNTAGDIILYLPAEKIVATGDIVVGPTPYGFGSYPAAWAESLRKLKGLDHKIFVPGHGDIQRDDAYVDLLIETFNSVARQMDALVAQGLTLEEAKAKMDFSNVENRFTGGDVFLGRLFQIWFKEPIVEAAYKVARGENPELQ